MMPVISGTLSPIKARVRLITSGALGGRQRRPLAGMAIDEYGADALRRRAILQQPVVALPVDGEVVGERQDGGDGDAFQRDGSSCANKLLFQAHAAGAEDARVHELQIGRDARSEIHLGEHVLLSRAPGAISVSTSPSAREPEHRALGDEGDVLAPLAGEAAA